jgi:hypothetical protein
VREGTRRRTDSHLVLRGWEREGIDKWRHVPSNESHAAITFTIRSGRSGKIDNNKKKEQMNGRKEK